MTVCLCIQCDGSNDAMPDNATVCKECEGYGEIQTGMETFEPCETCEGYGWNIPGEEDGWWASPYDQYQCSGMSVIDGEVI